MPDTVIKSLFDIPVYRCSEAQHGKEFVRQIERHMQGFDKKAAPESYAKIEKWFIRTYWYPWKFNEIVGYVHLTFEGSPEARVKIVGDLFYPRAKRIVRGGKGRIFGTGKVFEHFVWPKHTSQQIYKDLLRGLERLNKERPLDRRYLYLEDFRRLGPIINWRKLLGFE